MIPGKYSVFIVDDSSDDRFFMRTMLQRSRKLEVIGEAHDGQEVMDYLSQAAETHNLPNVLILDLKMPRRDGYDVLAWLKEHQIQNLLVVVTSGSCLAEDITRSLALGAHSYFKKTSIREEQNIIIRDIENLVEKAIST